MIQSSTLLKVLDNSGGKKVKCIKVLGGHKRRVSHLGDYIIVSIKSAKSRGKVKKGEVKKALLIRTRKGLQRQDGSFISFDHNGVLLLNEQQLPLGSRILGPVTHELRKEHKLKIMSLTRRIL